MRKGTEQCVQQGSLSAHTSGELLRLWRKITERTDFKEFCSTIILGQEKTGN